MRLIRLTKDYNITIFDCGDDDLNAFLVEDAKGAIEKRVAKTLIIEDEGRIVAYCSLLNDRISRQDVTNSHWKKIRERFPTSKQFRSYPCVKVGRLAVAKDYHGQHLGRQLINSIKMLLNENDSYSAFRFLTVDAYISAVGFYESMGFVKLTRKEEDEHTCLMYFDMLELEE